MQILTIDGYIPAEDVLPGMVAVAYNPPTDEPLYQYILGIERLPVPWDPRVTETRFFKINNNPAWVFYADQSIWANDNVTHVKNLRFGDVIYAADNSDIYVTSVEVVTRLEWFRLHVDGDHSFISNGIVLHNASRFWVLGTGNWDGSDTSHWSASSNGASGASAPTTSDAVSMDGNSGGGTCTALSGAACASYQVNSGCAVSLVFSGSFTFTCIGSFAESGGNASRSYNLGSATLNVGTWSLVSTPSARFNAGTSTVSMTGGTLTTTGVTFYDLSCSANALAISAANTFNNLTHTPSAPAKTDSLTLSADQIINGLLTLNGGSAVNRLLIMSNTPGTRRTLTAASLSTQNTSWRDIAGAGAASWNLSAITGDSSDYGNNSGITFTAPATQHWVNANGGNWDTAANWTSRVPLGQDPVVMDCAFGSNKTVTANMPTGGASLDWTGATWSGTLTFAASGTFYGNYTGISGLTTTGGLACYAFMSSATFTSNGQTFSASVVWSATSATWTIADNFSSTSTTGNNGNLTLAAGVSVTALSHSDTAGTITWGAGSEFVLTGNAATLWGGHGVSGSTSYSGAEHKVRLTYTGSTGTRTIATGSGPPDASLLDLYVTGGSDTLTISGGKHGKLDMTGSSATLSANTTVYHGDFILGNTAPAASATALSFGKPSGTQQLTSNGKTIDRPITHSGAGTLQLADNLTMGSSRLLTNSAGTFDDNGKTISAQNYNTSGSTTRTHKQAADWTLSGSGTVFDASTSTNLTVTLTGSPKIKLSSASAKTFAGGGKTWGILDQAGTGALTISGSNNFADIQNSAFGDLKVTAGTTQTVSAFSYSGDASHQLSLDSTTSTAFTLSKSSGTVNVSYLTIAHSTATGGAAWNAPTNNGNVDGGNNSGWNFHTAYSLTAEYAALSLSGQAATLRTVAASPMAAGSFSLNGQSAVLRHNQTTALEAGEFDLTGQDMEPTTVTRLIGDAGSINLSGQAAALRSAMANALDAGAFELAGQDANLRADRTTLGEMGAFSLAGQSATMRTVAAAALAHGAFALNGQAASLRASYAAILQHGAFSLSGVEASLASQVRSLLDAGQFTLAGQGASLRADRFLVADHGVYTLSGQPAGLGSVLAMVAHYGGFVLSGQAAALRTVTSIAPAAASFALTGQDAALTAQHRMIGDFGALSLSGQSMIPVTVSALEAEMGAFSLAGQGAALRSARTAQLAVGLFSMTGVPASLHTVAAAALEAGAFAITGKDANLAAQWALAAAHGAFTLNGQPMSVRMAYRIFADTGSLTLDGQNASLVAQRRFGAEMGAFGVSGQPAALLAAYRPALAVGAFALNGQSAFVRWSARLTMAHGEFTLTGVPTEFSFRIVLPPGHRVILAAPRRGFLVESRDRDVILARRSREALA